MRIDSAEIWCVSLPFVEKFSHSLGTRNASESIVVCVRSARGSVGWGEGMPRTYVTGEDFDTCMQQAKQVLWPALKGQALPADGTFSEMLARLDGLLEPHAVGGTVVHNAVRCAFEIATVDAWLRERGRTLTEELPRARDEIAYSAVIPTGSIEATTSHAKQYKMLGFDQVKVKIDGTEDVARLEAVRAVFGPDASLRVDGNAAYTVDAALDTLRAMPGVESAEQMLKRGWLTDWARLTASSPVPIMVDESLVTEEDAISLIQAKACKLFNLRVSKCGGIGPTLRIAELARTHRLGFQLGCHVGETAILSAVGRHLACHLADARWVEGSFGNLLLKEDLAQETVRFGHRGRARFLAGPGIGVEVRPDVVNRHAVRAQKLD